MNGDHDSDMLIEKYEQEAEWIARRYYLKDWRKLSGKLREDIYQMAVEIVNNRDKYIWPS